MDLTMKSTERENKGKPKNIIKERKQVQKEIDHYYTYNKAQLRLIFNEICDSDIPDFKTMRVSVYNYMRTL